MSEIPPLFAACDGLQFYDLYARRGSALRADVAAPGLYTIRAGVYPTGNGALVVMDPQGEMECKITVNMGGSHPWTIELAETEFCVKVVEMEQLRTSILKMGFFEETLARIDAGHATHYADVWRFTTCQRTARAKVLCKHCLDEYKKTLEQKKERIESRDAIARLRSLGRGDL